MGSNSETPAIPWMRLGELDPQSSLTPPPAPFPPGNSAADNARQRFAVKGNAICMSFHSAYSLRSLSQKKRRMD